MSVEDALQEVLKVRPLGPATPTPFL
jgi:hypothetical protein